MAEADLCQVVVGCRRLRVDGKRGTWILEPWAGMGRYRYRYHALPTYAPRVGRRDHHRQFGRIWVQQLTV